MEAVQSRPVPKPRKSLANKISAPLVMPNGPSKPPLPPRASGAAPVLPTPIMTPPPIMTPLGPIIDVSQKTEKYEYIASPPILENEYSEVAPDRRSERTDSVGSYRTAPSLKTFSSRNGSVSSEQSLESTTSSVARLRVASTVDSLICTDQSDGESVCFSGWVQLTQPKKEAKRCWAVIRKNQLGFMESDEVESPFLGPLDLSRMLFVGETVDSPNSILIVIREVTHGKHAAPCSTYCFAPEENLAFWLVLLTKCNCPRSETLQNSLTSVKAAGKLWIRQGVTGIWTEGWANIHDRVLFYWVQGFDVLFECDIRKVVLMKRDIPVADWCNRIEHSTSGPILIALEGSSLYLQSEFDGCTKIWQDVLEAELRHGGGTLEENRLTADNVPVIVEKCIKFISTYGLYQRGIYRKNGSTAEARQLFEELRRDPFNAHLKHNNDETTNAVADVLRSFFRQLDRPLFPVDAHKRLYAIAEMEDHHHKPIEYQEVIFSLPTIHLNTLRKLLAHLHEVTEHANVNLASIDNIAKVFGPTTFSVDKQDVASIETYASAGRQIHVMRDLLHYYNEIFLPSTRQLSAKHKLDEVQEKQNAVKTRAEGFLVPVHLFDKDNKCFNVQSDWTAAQILDYKLKKLDMYAHIDSYALFEVVRNGAMERRIGTSETLTSIVLVRWLEWEHSECYVLLKKDPYPFQPQNIRPFADDVKFAENGSKSFKTIQLKVEAGTRIVQYSKNMKQQNAWNVDEMLWFVGTEPDRKAPYSYNLTFFLTTGPSKTKYKAKHAGYCVSFKEEVQMTQWLNAVTVCKQEYLPAPLIQI